MPGVNEVWERCGNTPYYRFGNGYNWTYIDPYNFRMITTSMDVLDGFEVVQAVYREAPRYDWPIMRKGSNFVSQDKMQEMEILKLTHEWAHHLITNLKKTFRKDRLTMPMKESFEEGDAASRAAVLRGVHALIEGFAREDLENFMGKEQLKNKMVISINASQGILPDEMRNIESGFPKLDNMVLANNTQEALEAVLAEFEIYEC